MDSVIEKYIKVLIKEYHISNVDTSDIFNCATLEGYKPMNIRYVIIGVSQYH